LVKDIGNYLFEMKGRGMSVEVAVVVIVLVVKSKAVPLHARKAPGGRGGIAPIHS
jgi:hypothetical protein